MLPLPDLDREMVGWIVTVVQVVGLLSAWLARRSMGQAYEQVCQRLFFGCLVLVAVATMLALGIQAHCWIFSAITLALMIMAAVWDLSGGEHAEAS